MERLSLQQNITFLLFGNYCFIQFICLCFSAIPIKKRMKGLQGSGAYLGRLFGEGGGFDMFIREVVMMRKGWNLVGKKN